MAKMPSILEYTKRVGRSMAYGAFDAIKETMPITSSLIENNAQTARDLYKEVTQSKTQLNRLKTMQDTYLFKPANQLMKNLKADLRSGNFYHPERAAKAEEQGAQDMMKALLAEEGMEDLMDLLNGDEELSPEEMQELPVTPDASITTGDAVVATTIAKEQRRATHASVDAHTKIAEAQMATQRTLSNIQLKHMERHTHTMVQGFGKMTEGFNNIMRFNQEVVLQHAKNSQQYFTEMTQLTRENNAILKEFIEMKRAQFKRDTSNDTSGIPKNPFGNGGAFDLKEYLNVIKSNFDDSIFGLAGMMLAGIPAMIAGIVANPIHFASKQLFKGFLGPALRGAMKGFDKNITGMLQTGLAKLANWGNSSQSGLLGELGKIFGIQTKDVNLRTVDMSKALKGPRQWDAEDHHFLTKVIPSYLSNIEAALSGKEARHFSSDTGKWTTTSMMKKKYRQQEQAMADANTAELQNYLKQSLYATLNINTKDPKSKKNVQELNALIRDFAMGVQKQGGLGVGVGENAQYKDILNNPNKVYGDNENILKLIFDLVKRAETDQKVRSIVLGTNSNVINSKHAQYERRMSGNLTDAEKFVATNSDMSGRSLRLYDELSMSLALAEAQGDQDRALAIRKAMENMGANYTPGTSDKKNKLKGGTRQTKNISSPLTNNNMSLLDWQPKIYEVLCQIRDGRGIGQPSTYRRRVNRARRTRGRKGTRKTSTVASSDDDDGPPISDLEAYMDEMGMLDSYTVTSEGAIVRNAAYDVLMGKQYGTKHNARTSMNVGDLDKILRDPKAAQRFRTEMNRNWEKAQKGHREYQMEYDTGIADSILGSDMSVDDLNAQLKKYGAKPKDPFLKQLAAAGSLGDKLGVISTNINKLLASPRAVFTSVLTSADQMMYELLFGKDTDEIGSDGKPIKGFFGKVMHEMDKAGISLNKAISDISNKIYDNKGKWWNQAKGFAKDTFGLDVDQFAAKAKDKLSFVGNSAKNAAQSIVGDVKNAVKGTITDFREGNFNQQKPKDIPGKAFGQYPALVSKGEAVFNSDGSGTRNVTKSGVTTIDSNSVVIPSNQNPWNPSRMSANPMADYQNENRIRSRISSRLGSSNGARYANALPGFAQGKQNLVTYLFKKIQPDELMSAIGPVQGLLQSYGIDPNMALDLVADFAGGRAGGLINSLNLTPDDKKMLENALQYVWHSPVIRNNPTLQRFAEKAIRSSGYEGRLDSNEEMLNQDYSRKSGVFNGMQQFALQATGTDPAKALEETKKYIVHNTPELMKGGMAGALLGTVLPLGGPLFGAAAGAAVSLLSNNKSFMNYLFGEEVVDENGNKSRKDNGLISAKFAKTLEKYVPDAKKFGIAGGLLGAVTGFGPLGGIMVGLAGSYIKNNEEANKAIFGDKGGLLNKNRKEAIKKAFPNVAAGVLSTFFLGPFGLLGNAVFGAGLGLLSTTELFKKTLLGTKDKQGVRHGGLAGAIRRHITNPLKKNMDQMKKDFGKWFRDDVTKPLGRGLKPIADEVKNILKKGSNTILDTIEGVLRGAGGTKMERFLDFTLGNVRRAGGLGKLAAQTFIGKPVGWLAKGIEGFGNKIRERQLGNAEITDTAAKFLSAELRDKGIKGNRMQLAYDTIAGMHDDEVDSEAQNLRALAEFYSAGTKNGSKRREGEVMDNLTSVISKITENPEYTENAKGIHGKLMELAERVRSDTSSEKIDVATELQEIMRGAHFNIQDTRELEDVFQSSNKSLAGIRRAKKWLKDGKSEVIQEALSRARKLYTDNNMDDEDFIKLIPNLAELLEHENGNRAKIDAKMAADVAKHGGVVDMSLMHPEKNIETLNQNTTATNDLTKSINYLTAKITGEEPLKIMKSLNLMKDVRDISYAEEEHDMFWREGEKRGKEKVAAAAANNVDKMKALNAFDTVKGMSEEDADYVMSGSNKNAFAKAFIELSRAFESGNKAIVQDFNEIFKIDPTGKLFQRIADFTILGLEVDPRQYKEIDELDDDGFETAREFAKLKVPIDNFSIFKDIDKKTGDKMVAFAAAKITLADGSTTSVGKQLIADEIHKLWTDSSYATALGVNDADGVGSTDWVDRYTNPNNPNYKPFQTDMLKGTADKSALKSTFKEGGLSGEQFKANQANQADVGDITDQYGGIVGVGQSAVGAVSDFAKWCLNAAKDLGIGALDVASGRMNLGSNIAGGIRTAGALIGGSDQFREDAAALASRKLWNATIGDTIVKKVATMLGEKANLMITAGAYHPQETYGIVKDLYDKKITVEEALAKFNGLIDSSQAMLAEDSMTSAQRRAKEMPQHAKGKVAATAAKGAEQVAAKGGWKNAIKGMLGGTALGSFASSLFGGDDDKKDDESSSADANQDSAGGISSDAATAAGAAAGAIYGGNQFMASAMNAPLQRGQTVVIPTPYGPKTYTTSSSDGGMMAAHTKDNTEVEAKEQADIERKERTVSLLEKISGKLGDAGKKVKKGAKAIGGGLLDGLLGLAGLPFKMITGLVGALGAIPFIGPIFKAVLSPISGIFSKITGEAAEEGAKKGAKEAAKKPGLVKRTITKLLGSKVGKVLAVVSAFLGYDLLSDGGSSAEASTPDRADGDKPGVRQTKKDDSISVSGLYDDIVKKDYKDKGFIGKTLSNIASPFGYAWDVVSNHPILSALGVTAGGATLAGINGYRKGGTKGVASAIAHGIPSGGRIGKALAFGAGLLGIGSAGKAIYDNSARAQYNTGGPKLFKIEDYPEAYQQFGQLSPREQIQCDAYVKAGRDPAFIINWLGRVRQLNGGRALGTDENGKFRTKNDETWSSAGDTTKSAIRSVAISTGADKAAKLWTKAPEGSIKHSLISGGLATAYKFASGDYEGAMDAAQGFGKNVLMTYGINKGLNWGIGKAQTYATNAISDLVVRFRGEPEFQNKVQQLLKSGGAKSEKEAMEKVAVEMAEKRGIKVFSKQGIAKGVRAVGDAASHLGKWGKAGLATAGIIGGDWILSNEEGAGNEALNSVKQLGANILGAKAGEVAATKLGGGWKTKVAAAVLGGQAGGMLAGGDFSMFDVGMDAVITGAGAFNDWRKSKNNPLGISEDLKSKMTPDQITKLDQAAQEIKAQEVKVAEIEEKLKDPNLSNRKKKKLTSELGRAKKRIENLTNKSKSIIGSVEKAAGKATEVAKDAKKGIQAGEKAAVESAKNSTSFFEKASQTFKNAKDTVMSKVSTVTKTADTAKDAAKAAEEVAENKGLISKIKDALGYIKDGATKYIPGGDKWKAGVTALCDAVEKYIMSKETFEKIKKKVTQQAARFIPVVGWVLTAAFVASGVYEGLAHTEEILNIPSGTATMGMKAFAAIIGALTGAPIIGLIPAKTLVDICMKVCDVLGFGAEDLRRLRKQKEKDDKLTKDMANDKLVAKQADYLQQQQTNHRNDGDWDKNISANVKKDIDQRVKTTAENHANDPNFDKKKYEEMHKKSISEQVAITRKAGEEAVQKRQGSTSIWQKGNKSLVRRGLDWVGEKWDNFWGNNSKDRDENHGGRQGGFGKYGRGDHDLARQDVGPLANVPMNLPGEQGNTVGNRSCAAYALENAFRGLEGTDPSGRRIGSLVQESMGYMHKNDGADPKFIHDAAMRRGYRTQDLSSQSDFTNALNNGQVVVGMGRGDSGPWGPGMHYEQFEKGSRPGYAKVYDSEESEVREYPISDISSGMTNAISLGKGKYGRGGRPWWFGRAKDFMNPEEIAIEISKNTKLPPELIWAQMALETGHFSSALAKEHNYGGVKSAEGKAGFNTPNTKGQYSWTVTGEDARHHSYFNNDQSFVNYMSWYYPLYKEDGLMSATSPAEWAAALKRGQYYTADESQYAANIKGILEGDPAAVQRLKANRPSDAPPLNMNGGSSSGVNSSGGGNGGLFEQFFGAVNAALGTSLGGQYIKNVFGSDFKFGSNGATPNNSATGTPNSSATVVSAPQSGSAAEAITSMMGNAPITSPYGPRGGRLHAGIDIGVSDGTDVPCPVDGVIDDIGNDANGYGDFVVVKDKKGNYHIFGHNSNNKLCSKGDTIVAGTIVAKSGHSGHCIPDGPDGAHVHYGIYPPENPNCAGETPINPSEFKVDGLATNNGRGKYGKSKAKAKVTGFTTGSDAGWREDQKMTYGQKRRYGYGKYGRGSQDSVFMQDLKMANSMDPLKNTPAQLKSSSNFGIKDSDYRNSFGKGKFGRGSEGVPEKVWNFLSPKIGSVATAAVMGNMEAESGYDPAAVNSSSGASGLCQWLGQRKTALMNKAQSMGKDWRDTDVQLAYLWEEMDNEWQGKTYKQWLNEINNAGNVEEGAAKWEEVFERSGHTDSYPRRKKSAKEAFEKQGKGIKTNGAATGGGGSSSGGGGGLFGWFKSKLDSVIANSPVGAIWRAVWGTPGGGSSGGGGANASSGQSLSGVKETNLTFSKQLEKRSATNKIIIHHTGDGDESTDPDAKTIHGWHQKNGWAGIGYHFVIRKDGSIERGRPEETVGSHAQGSNNDSIGIHVGGAFDKCQPTEAQIGSLVNLIRDLCKKYNIPVDRKHIIGHREVNQTSCPGNNLYSRLDDIVKRAASGGVASAPAAKSDSGSSSTVPPAEAAKKEDAVATNAGAEEKKDKNGNTDIYSQENEWVKQNKSDGNVYTKNDLDYLMKQGYSMQDAVWYLRNQNGQGKGKFGRGKFGRLKDLGRSANARIGASVRNAQTLGKMAKSYTANHGANLAIPSGYGKGSEEADIASRFTSGNGVVNGRSPVVRHNGRGTQLIESGSVNFTELLTEQKKTNSLLEGILKAIIASGQGSNGNAKSIPGMNVFGGNSGYMEDLNGQSYTPIARSLEWLSEPK